MNKNGKNKKKSNSSQKNMTFTLQFVSLCISSTFLTKYSFTFFLFQSFLAILSLESAYLLSTFYYTLCTAHFFSSSLPFHLSFFLSLLYILYIIIYLLFFLVNFSLIENISHHVSKHICCIRSYFVFYLIKPFQF